MTVRDSDIVANTAGSNGGGILNSGVGSNFVLDSSTIRENVSDYGGGLYNAGKMEIKNSTLSGNTARLCAGAAIYQNSSTKLEMISSTVALHVFGTGSRCGAIFLNSTSEVGLKNSIVDEGSLACGGLSGSGGSGTVTSGGYNIDRGSSCALNAAGDQQKDPKIEGLANNGGPTLTHGLQDTIPKGPAVDWIPLPTGNDSPDSDQRTAGRFGPRALPRAALERRLPGGGGVGVDVGAYELSALTITKLTPPSRHLGSPLQTVTVEGKGFTTCSKVWFLGRLRRTTVKSSTLLEFEPDVPDPLGQRFQPIDQPGIWWVSVIDICSLEASNAQPFYLW